MYMPGQWMPARKAKAPFWRWVLLGALVVITATVLVLGTAVVTPPVTRFSLTENTLEVISQEGLLTLRKRFALDQLQEAAVISPGRGRKLSGARLEAYCRGWFSYQSLGKVWQATDCRSPVILLRFSQTSPVLVAPADFPGFLAALQARRTHQFPLRQPTTPASTPGWLALIVGAMVLTLLLTVLMVLMGPRRLAYAVEPGQLVVRLFSHCKRFPIAGASVRPWQPKGLLRIAGTSLPGYHVGVFWDPKGKVRVYASDLSQGILFAAHQRIFISPAQEEEFLTLLREVGGVQVAWDSTTGEEDHERVPATTP
ncbi:MAG: PH domain-containing protein [Thermoanaerobaculum sp.]|nr:PH domain-containing protein [Thermoanaerobaculum sp.]MDW7967808.1 PH domain-containing protein [Thermoanaerobaculum sp.]